MKIYGRFLGSFKNNFLISETNYYRLKIQADVKPHNFDIIEITGYRDKDFIVAEKIKIIKEGQEIGGTENWKKIIYDTETKEEHIKMQKSIQKIRNFFLKKDFLEVYTPILVKYPAMEPNLDSFETKFEKKEKLYLHTSPEYFMKKLLTAGLYRRIFEITPVFRNNELGKMHNPEFLMLEWYRMFKSYDVLMEDLLELVRYLIEDSKINYLSREVDITDYKKITVRKAFQKYADIDLDDLIKNRDNWKEKFFELMVNKIEPNLGWKQPTVLYEYPKEMAALAKLKETDKSVAKRFEFYIAGIELANCFEELNDPKRQLERFKEQKTERVSAKLKNYPIDKTFINALKIGMPPSSGGALGLNRLLMIIFNKKNIRKTLLFPFTDL
ncbi:MAG: EF-P lysine aminoacylase GenX [Candidatus Mcinerneyibacterium aminivorans]|uniref:EF-P lysine aminoacylase GenX n=1 Tax=Candidatus Mcinerneyibacterium aminivorans TaxID=2703815 RepID=A0A5D0MHA6_9BACT|nr:MAG: EF-P lysine aminoacylase GenX [Candidatus Mcinerneyibacterium aminivorans]